MTAYPDNTPIMLFMFSIDDNNPSFAKLNTEKIMTPDIALDSIIIQNFNKFILFVFIYVIRLSTKDTAGIINLFNPIFLSSIFLFSFYRLLSTQSTECLQFKIHTNTYIQMLTYLRKFLLSIISCSLSRS